MPENILRDMRTGILRWYPFQEGKSILLVTGKKDDFLCETRDSVIYWLEHENYDISTLSMDKLVSGSDGNRYDYIILIGIIEYSGNPVELLVQCKGLLSSGGHLLIAMDNRLGLRYFAGDHDIFTDRSFDGIEGYEKLFQRDRELFGGRSYARFEVNEFLGMAGFENVRFFSVFPDIRVAQYIYAEDYAPNEDMSVRYFPFYNNPESVFLNEGRLINTISKNGMLHQMANGYLVECASIGANCSDICNVTMSLDRGDNDMITIIRKSKYESVEDISDIKDFVSKEYVVEKKSVNGSGERKIEELIANNSRLRSRKIKTIPMKKLDGRLIMPYIEADGGMDYFKKQALVSKEAFLDALDKFYELILESSEEAEVSDDYIFAEDIVTQKPVRCKNAGKVLKYGYPDMVPLNTFVINGEFYFYDQEFSEEIYPAKAVMYRVISLIYTYGKLSSDEFNWDMILKRYEMQEDRVQWEALERNFCNSLLNKDLLLDFRKKHSAENSIIVENLERVSFGAQGYRRIFSNVIDGCLGKKLIIFGSGSFAKRFISLFKNKFRIEFLVDNDDAKHGTFVEGIEIKPPEVLKKLSPDSFKLIICIRQYSGILKQIRDYGVTDYGIFNPDADYNIPDYLTNNRKSEIVEKKNNSASKPYHTGYVAGVFDLFHVGHLNILKRAKENCDYLIVGLVTDEGVRKGKGISPVITYEDRKAILEGCRYVDEVVEIPLNAGGSLDAWRLNHFDVQFSGSDYEHDEYWLNMKSELEKHGATIVFFPYTESTSSTKLKEKLKNESNNES